MRSGELWRGDSLVSTLNSTRCWATTSKALSIIPLRYYHRNSTSISHVLMIIIITIIIPYSIITLPYDKILPSHSHSRSHHQSYPTIPFASSSSSSSASASTSIHERSIGDYMTYLATFSSNPDPNPNRASLALPREVNTTKRHPSPCPQPTRPDVICAAAALLFTSTLT